MKRSQTAPQSTTWSRCTQVCRSFDFGYLDTLRRCRVLEYQRPNVAYLDSLGVEALYLPFGFHQSLVRCAPAEKDIDVLFVGTMTPRRLAVLRDLAWSGLQVRYVQGCYGAELDQLVARSKVNIVVHRYEGHPLEVVRVNYLMANGGCVISERGWDDAETAAYDRGVIFSEFGDLAATAIACVKEGEWQPMQQRAREVIQGMPMDIAAARAWLGIEPVHP